MSARIIAFVRQRASAVFAGGLGYVLGLIFPPTFGFALAFLCFVLAALTGYSPGYRPTFNPSEDWAAFQAEVKDDNPAWKKRGRLAVGLVVFAIVLLIQATRAL